MLWNGTNGNEKIDNLIQEMQSRIDSYDDMVFEWIPYNQFNYVEETRKNEFVTVYSTKWKWVHYVMIYIQKYMKDIQIRSYIKMF